MSLPRFEVASGTIDGVNTTFYVSVPYAPNTVAVLLNGMAVRKDYANGWIETDPTLGKLDLKEAPLQGDILQVFFSYTPADGQLDLLGTPRFEVASGAVDGSNVTFVVGDPYTPDTTAVFLNGVAQIMSFDDGWFETSPTAGVVTLKEAPLVGDIVKIFYIYRSAAADLEGRAGVCPRLFGKICETATLAGRLQDITPVSGMLQDPITVYGRL